MSLRPARNPTHRRDTVKLRPADGNEIQRLETPASGPRSLAFQTAVGLEKEFGPSLRRSAFTERPEMVIPITAFYVQRALYKHRCACGFDLRRDIAVGRMDGDW